MVDRIADKSSKFFKFTNQNLTIITFSFDENHPRTGWFSFNFVSNFSHDFF